MAQVWREEGGSATVVAPLRDGVEYDGHPSMIAAARGFTDDFLERAARRGVPVGGRQRETARLVVSELVTNAVRHAPGPCRLVLDLGAGTLQVAVTDTSTAVPVAQERRPERIGRHGLEIVLAVCESVECRQLPQGKTVYARLALND
jgi:anti-sigma regulatory factor (Ser/Thr protein kinase)